MTCPVPRMPSDTAPGNCHRTSGQCDLTDEAMNSTNPRASAAPGKQDDFSTEVTGVCPLQSNCLCVHSLYMLEEKHARNLTQKARQTLLLNNFLLSTSLPAD